MQSNIFHTLAHDALVNNLAFGLKVLTYIVLADENA